MKNRIKYTEKTRRNAIAEYLDYADTPYSARLKRSIVEYLDYQIHLIDEVLDYRVVPCYYYNT